MEKLHRQAKHIVSYSYRSLGLYYFVTDYCYPVFDRECPARGPIPDSSLLLPLFMKFVQLTIDGAEFGTEALPGGIVWH